MKKGYARKISILALSVALSMILSFVESLIPPLSAVPGVKLGLANVATVFVLYTLGFPEAVLVSAVRVLLSALLFGNAASLIYSASGAVMALLTMLLVKKLSFAGEVGVSVSGAVMHNLGQVIAAAIVMQTAEIVYYFIPLLISGTVAGVLIGIAAAIVCKRVKLSGD